MRHLDSKKVEHHDASMRTTVTLDPDVAEKLKELAHQRKSSFKETLNDVLRRGFSAGSHRKPPGKFVVKPHAGGFRPGIDPARLNQLLDDLDADDFVAEARRTE